MYYNGCFFTKNPSQALLGKNVWNHQPVYHCFHCRHGLKNHRNITGWTHWKGIFLAVDSVEGQRIEMIEMPNEDDGYGFQNHKKISWKPFQKYRGEDCMDVFIQKIIEVKNEIMERTKENKDIVKRADDWKDFKTAKKCFICGKDFKEVDKKVRDHCHFTGKYRGCAHDDCNLQFAKFAIHYYKIPVFLQNLKNYDSHLLIERANELSERGKIDVIAQNSEKFITFAFKNLCFKDTCSFLPSSLDKLVKLGKYEDGNRKENWQNNFKFSKINPLVMTRIWIYLLTKGYIIHTTTSLLLTTSEKSNYLQKSHSTVISPKVILKMMSMKGHKGYGNISV